VFRPDDKQLIRSSWPIAAARDSSAEELFAHLQDAVRGFRNVRALLDLPAGDMPQGSFLCEERALAESLLQESALIRALTNLSGLEAISDTKRLAQSGTDVFSGGSVFLPFGTATDMKKLRTSLEKKQEKIQRGIQAIVGKLSNERFVQNADADVVQAEKMRKEDLERELRTLEQNLTGLS
tara:strand:- start:147 stop:689 length:543 start_codon:yes stop_codon:yes gene_type:complete